MNSKVVVNDDRVPHDGCCGAWSKRDRPIDKAEMSLAKAADHIHVYACLYTCLHTCLYTCPHTCLYACPHTCLYTCPHTCPYACPHTLLIHMSTHMSTHLWTHVSIHIFTHMSAHVCIHMSTHMSCLHSFGGIIEPCTCPHTRLYTRPSTSLYSCPCERVYTFVTKDESTDVSVSSQCSYGLYSHGL